MDIPRSDGDSLRMYLKALDVVGHETVDSVLVHVDSSPPRITNIGLTKDGQTLLAVHNSKDLFDMTLDGQTITGCS